MIHLDIRLQPVNAPPAFAELHHLSDNPLDLFGCAIIQKGTASGEPAVMFLAKQGETVLHFQLTANLLEAVASVLAGARERWNVPKKP